MPHAETGGPVGSVLRVATTGTTTRIVAATRMATATATRGEAKRKQAC